MNGIFFLAWRYVVYHKIKTAILTTCLTLTILLPMAAHLLIEHYGDALMARADDTPLVVGARGNRFDLVLKALYFSSTPVDSIGMNEVEVIRDTGLAMPIPLIAHHTARKRPVVGTTPEYFTFRSLRPRTGTLPLRLGQATLGATVAAELGLEPGDTLFSDQQSLYDISTTYPLKMAVVGVLEPSGSPDDYAVFVDVKTAWIIEGIAHGHQNVTTQVAADTILQRTPDSVTVNESIVQYNEVTPQNLDSFHTHAAAAELPLSAVIVVPNDVKSGTLLKARYNVSKTRRVLVPTKVVDELMGLVFKIKAIFDAGFALIVCTTIMFLMLVVLLSQRLRKQEMETMSRIGCSRATAFWLQAAELGIVLGIAVVLAAALTAAAIAGAPQLVRLL